MAYTSPKIYRTIASHNPVLWKCSFRRFRFTKVYGIFNETSMNCEWQQELFSLDYFVGSKSSFVQHKPYLMIQSNTKPTFWMIVILVIYIVYESKRMELTYFWPLIMYKIATNHILKIPQHAYFMKKWLKEKAALYSKRKNETRAVLVEVSIWISTTWWASMMIDQWVPEGTCSQVLWSTSVDS